MKSLIGVVLIVTILAPHGRATQLVNGDFEATALVGAGQSADPGGGKKLINNPLDPGYSNAILGIPNWINSFEPAGWRDAGLARINFGGSGITQLAFINNWETRLSQVSGWNLGPGDIVQAGIFVGFDGPFKAGKFQLWAGAPDSGNPDTFPSSAVLLSEVSVATPDWTNYVANETFSIGEWHPLQLNYTAPSSGLMIGQPLTVSFLTSSGSAGATLWDNAFLSTTLGPTTVEWNNPAGGQFSDGGNWVGGNSPAATSKLLFNLAGNYAAGFSADEENDSLTVQQGMVSFNLHGHAHELEIGTNVIGKLAGDSASLILTSDAPNGIARYRAISLAEASGASGNLTVDGADTSLVAETIDVGSNGTGVLTISNSADATVQGTGINQISAGKGNGSNGTIVVTGAGSVLSGATTHLTVGGTFDADTNGHGELQVLNGGSVSVKTVVVGDGVATNTSDGEIIVSGAGSMFTVLGTGLEIEEDLIVGKVGDGTLQAENGGAIKVVGNIEVGDVGNGSLHVLNGGTIELNGDPGPGTGHLTVRRGEVIVSGPGSHLSGSGLDARGIDASGTRSVEISDQANVEFEFALIGLAASTTSTISISGGAHFATSSGVTNSVIGGGGTGLSSVSGAGSRWDSAHQIVIAQVNLGKFQISDGAVVESQSASSATGTSGIVGRNPTANGSVTITGVGSRWNQDGGMNIGWQGTGAVSVTQGGLLESQDGVIARLVGSTGNAEIRDAGSAWNVTRSFYVAGTATAAGGTGTLTIADGGAVTVPNTLKIWSAGTVNVSGGGRVSVGDAPLPAAGTVHVGSGGVVTGNGTITGNVIVDGSTGTEVGAILPGNSAGVLTINGNLTQASNSLLEIEVGGVTPGTQHDKVVVTGNAAIGGQLDVPIVNGYVPQVGHSMTILTAANVTGQFSGLFAPELQAANPNVAIDLDQSATDVQIHFVAPVTTTQFTPNNAVIDWTNPNAWNTGVEPDSRHVITIQNPMAPDQQVEVQGDDAFVHELVVKGDSTHAVTLNINNERTLSATVSARAVRATVVVGDPTSAGRVTSPNVDLRDGAELRGKKAKIAAQTAGNAANQSRQVTLSNRMRDLRRISAALFPHVGEDEPVELGSLVAPGLLAPGEHIGQIEVFGNYEQDEESFLEMEIESLSSFDKFIVTDESSLAGTLDVSLLNSFAPQAGDSFDLFDWGTVVGAFDVLQFPFLASGLTWNTNQLYMLGTLAIRRQGDYDVNGVVNGDDFLAWQRQLGSSVTAYSGADGDGNGVVDAADLTGWRNNFGAGGNPGSTSIPEPRAATLILLAVMGAVCGRCKVIDRSPRAGSSRD